VIGPVARTPVWDRPATVAGFVAAAPNAVLRSWVRERSRGQSLSILDIGCGAGRNAVPLAQDGHRVTGVDLSLPMLEAARARASSSGVAPWCTFVEGTMENLPVPDAAFELVIAHGVWNLAGSDRQLEAAMAEAARVARPKAGLFVFTFSRNTLADDVEPAPGQRYAFTEFAGTPQTFVTENELDTLLGAVGFDREHPGPLTEFNRPGPLAPGSTARHPVIWEGTWVKRSP